MPFGIIDKTNKQAVQPTQEPHGCVHCRHWSSDYMTCEDRLHVTCGSCGKVLRDGTGQKVTY